MGLEGSKAIVRRLYEEVISHGNLALADELIAEDLVDHSNPPGWPQGREGAKENIAYIRGAFTGWRCAIEEMLVDGDLVALRGTFRGAHTGEFFGIAPTGRPVTMTGIHILRVADGKIVEHWANNDDLGLLRQLGAVPPRVPAAGHDAGRGSAAAHPLATPGSDRCNLCTLLLYSRAWTSEGVN